MPREPFPNGGGLQLSTLTDSQLDTLTDAALSTLVD